MTDQVVSFSDMAFKLRGQRYFKGPGDCRHLHTTLDDDGEIVTCDDCGKQLSAYWVLRKMAEKWAEHARQVTTAAERVNDYAKAVIHLRAAKRVESIWRGRKMAPLCPHCRAAILPEDGLGNSSTSLEYELRRRRAVSADASKL